MKQTKTIKKKPLKLQRAKVVLYQEPYSLHDCSHMILYSNSLQSAYFRQWQKQQELEEVKLNMCQGSLLCSYLFCTCACFRLWKRLQV